jgi:hypothetical protein
VKVLFVSSEIYPLAKTGGLADVSAALPKALATLGVDIRLVLPGYPTALRVAAEQRPETKLDNLPDAALRTHDSSWMASAQKYLSLYSVLAPSLDAPCATTHVRGDRAAPMPAAATQLRRTYGIWRSQRCACLDSEAD